MILGIIPARYSSSRFPGKPLAEIAGRPMIEHTYKSASTSRLLDDIVIATDDERILNVCHNFGAKAIITPKDIATGSDRIAYAATKFPRADVLVNIQGDEPFIPGQMIDAAIEPLAFDKTVKVSTLAKRITSVEELKSPAVVKVVFDYQNNALYFSRSPIPYVRDARLLQERLKLAEIYKHIGLYVYRRESLFKFTSLGETDLEKAEKLEQLRMLENSMKIKIVVTEMESLSVDTAEDLQQAREYYTQLHR